MPYVLFIVITNTTGGPPTDPIIDVEDWNVSGGWPGKGGLV
jgi:hypothetical protein